MKDEFNNIRDGPTTIVTLAIEYQDRKATQQNPIVHLDDFIRFDASAGKVYLTGSARAYPFDLSKDFEGGRVQVHWSTDNWTTSNETPAVSISSNQTWMWKVPVADATKNSATLPANVTYALKYVSSAGTFWDNNYQSALGYNENYLRLLAPTCYNYNIDSASDLSGLLNLDAACYSDSFPITIQFRLDNNEYQSSTLLINSTALSNGPHVAQVQALIEGSDFAAGELKVGFNVKHTVKFLDQWAPIGPSASGGAVITDDNGSIYIGDDKGTIYKFAKYGDKTAVQTYSNPLVSSSISNIALDTSQNVYVLTKALSKFFANGTLDMSFGTSGSVSFDQQQFGSSKFCRAGYMNVIGGFIFISDTCNKRLVKLSLTTGAFVDELSLKETENGYVSFITKSVKGNLIVSRVVYQQPDIIHEIDPSTFHIVGSLQLDTIYTQIEGISVTPTKYFISDGFAKTVRVVDAITGKTIGTWNGSGGVDGTPGHFGDLRGSIVLGDDSFAAMSVSGAALQRFSQTLLS
ncbi:hypothetical protein HDU76_000456 [Blyttiomyces sp. JEL0837]|nr:hypothetical protein HDU76_000456 [Blyttiomyces sp. JEL0837]